LKARAGKCIGDNIVKGMTEKLDNSGDDVRDRNYDKSPGDHIGKRGYHQRNDRGIDDFKKLVVSVANKPGYKACNCAALLVAPWAINKPKSWVTRNCAVLLVTN